jgi:hypothetical protein
VSIGVRLFPAVHGHIADSVRDHVHDRLADRCGPAVEGSRRSATAVGLLLRVQWQAFSEISALWSAAGSEV